MYVFDRFCPQAPKHTVNVSVLPRGVHLGHGNVLVIEEAHEAGGTVPPDHRSVFLAQEDSVHVSVEYDFRSTVIGQHDQVAGITFWFRPGRSLGRGR